ncbi:MAG: zinc ABC transporter substrate-binding protein, partial [Solirubrobacterales bacterium]|nr:zinc ABC transporter substrate-binding protein [Solirubrobacterales bacterium]
GALIASDISHPGAGVDTALFGSLLTVGRSDILTAAIAAAIGLWTAATGGPRWLAQGMLGHRYPRWDALLFLAVSLAVLAQLSATGALLASSLLVLPAAAARPWVSSIRSWQLLTGSLALLSAFIGLLASLGFDTPPGATIALTAGVVVVSSLIIKRVTKPGTDRSIRKALAVTAAVGAAIALGGCAGSQTNPIVATTPIVGSITQLIAGPEFTVKTLVPSGADPHSYEPRPSDTAALAGAKVLVTSGAGLDDWVLKQKDKAGGKETVVDLASHAPVKLVGEQAGQMDPHWFHDPRNVAAAGKAIAIELSKTFPNQSAGFLQRAGELTSETRRLDAQARVCTARLTPLERNLVTDHDAFAYLAARLHLKVQGSILQSQSTVAAPSPRQIDSLAQE